MQDPDDWSNDAVIPVLETLQKSGIAVSAGAIEYELQRNMQRPPSRSTITRALKTLQEEDLITKPDEDRIYYELTEKGENYVSGFGEFS